jgi:hypothetical protein
MKFEKRQHVVKMMKYARPVVKEKVYHSVVDKILLKSTS